jgi:cell division protein FtsB
MSKKKKPLIFRIIIAAFIIGILILSYIGLLLEIKNYYKRINYLEASLAALKNKNTGLLVEKQILESEERITSIARNDLLMVPNESFTPVIEIDYNHVDNINRIVNSKYE